MACSASRVHLSAFIKKALGSFQLHLSFPPLEPPRKLASFAWRLFLLFLRLPPLTTMARSQLRAWGASSLVTTAMMMVQLMVGVRAVVPGGFEEAGNSLVGAMMVCQLAK